MTIRNSLCVAVLILYVLGAGLVFWAFASNGKGMRLVPEAVVLVAAACFWVVPGVLVGSLMYAMIRVARRARITPAGVVVYGALGAAVYLLLGFAMMRIGEEPEPEWLFRPLPDALFRPELKLHGVMALVVLSLVWGLTAAIKRRRSSAP